MKTRIKIACDFCSIELVLVQTDVTKLSDNFMSGQALCFNLYPGTKIRSFFFARMKYIQKRLHFKFFKINAILFIFCGQNKIASGHVRTVIALVNTCLTFLIRTAYVVNGIYCIRDKKVRKFYVYKFMNNLSIGRIY